MNCRTVLTVLLLVIILPCLNAQKKEIAQARAFIKSGKNIDKAETLMRTLLADSANRDNLKIHLTLCEALRKQYEEQNEKMYLKQKVDTANVFAILGRFFVACETLDSLDARLAAEKQGRPKHRQQYAAYLNTYRHNLRSAASYFMRQQNYQGAFRFNELYLECANQPLFADMKYGASPIAAYWATYAGYKLSNDSLTMRYAATALRDSTHLEYTLQYLAETYLRQDSTALYEKTLTEGFNSFGQSPYFFSKLMDYYNKRNRPDLAMAVVDKALQENDSTELLLFAKSTQLLNMGDYQACVTICDTIISRYPVMADAYYNAGVAYLNMAFETEKDSSFIAHRSSNKSKPATRRELLQAYYSKARPYMERYRELCPDEKEKWAAALYNIYLNLNMGKEFLEIDRLLR